MYPIAYSNVNNPTKTPDTTHNSSPMVTTLTPSHLMREPCVIPWQNSRKMQPSEEPYRRTKALRQYHFHLFAFSDKLKPRGLRVAVVTGTARDWRWHGRFEYRLTSNHINIGAFGGLKKLNDKSHKRVGHPIMDESSRECWSTHRNYMFFFTCVSCDGVAAVVVSGDLCIDVDLHAWVPRFSLFLGTVSSNNLLLFHCVQHYFCVHFPLYDRFSLSLSVFSLHLFPNVMYLQRRPERSLSVLSITQNMSSQQHDDIFFWVPIGFIELDNEQKFHRCCS